MGEICVPGVTWTTTIIVVVLLSVVTVAAQQIKSPDNILKHINQDIFKKLYTVFTSFHHIVYFKEILHIPANFPIMYNLQFFVYSSVSNYTIFLFIQIKEI